MSTVRRKFQSKLHPSARMHRGGGARVAPGNTSGSTNSGPLVKQIAKNDAGPTMPAANSDSNTSSEES